MITLYQKAAAIAIKLEQLDKELLLRPEWVLRRATAEEIDFYYPGRNGYHRHNR